jgi:hypothetical protein
MHIPIPIPIGVRRVAAVQGTVWKFVTCSHCKERYAYLLELKATGEDHDLLFLDAEGSAKRARAQAAQNLVKKSHNMVLPVPCPHCGHYQDDMAGRLKDEQSINALQIAGAVIAGLSLVPLLFGVPYLWIVTVVMAVAGLAVLARGYVRAFTFNPNAGDAGPRIELGRKHAVWGEQLAELVTSRGEAAGAPDGGVK